MKNKDSALDGILSQGSPDQSDSCPETEGESTKSIGGDKAERALAVDMDAMSFDERVEYLKKKVLSNPSHREIHYKTLRFCCKRHTLPEVEDFIGSCPEFPNAAQSQYFLLQFLLKGGGIEIFELDENGSIVTLEQKESLTIDEIDDLVVQLAYETNEYGRALVEQMSPKARLLEVFEITPHYYDTFIEVMEFLAVKRSFAEVDTLLRGRDVLTAGRGLDDPPIQPSVFIDALEKAGGIYWNKGWVLASEGEELLESLKKRRSETND
jgi:hypothetical protein